MITSSNSFFLTGHLRWKIPLRPLETCYYNLCIHQNEIDRSQTADSITTPKHCMDFPIYTFLLIMDSWSEIIFNIPTKVADICMFNWSWRNHLNLVLFSQSWIRVVVAQFTQIHNDWVHGCLSQDLRTGCPELAIINFLGLLYSREIPIYWDYDHKRVFTYWNKA